MVKLVCPQCHNGNEYHDDIDASKDVACASCGYSNVPTRFELAAATESRAKTTLTIIALALVAIGLLTGELLGGLILVAYVFPLLIPLFLYLLFRKRKKKLAQS